VDLSYLASSFALLAILAIGIYSVFYFVFRRSILSITDPLNTGLCLIAFYLAGALFLPSFHTVNQSYVYVVCLLFIYIFASAFFLRRPPRVREPHLAITPGHQLFFTLFLSGLIVINIIINQIFGVIPLLEGTQARADYGSVASPTLFLLSPDISMVVLLIFLLTKFKTVKIWAGIGVLASIVSTLLSGAKSSIFVIIFILFTADYVLNLRRSTYMLKQQIDAISKTIRTTRTWILLSAIGAALILPYYLVLLKADYGGGQSTGLQNLAIRLFGGFDALAIVAFQDIDITSVKGIGISDFYFYPVLKHLSHAPEFQSAGQYLIYLETGSYQLASSGLNPNSSFAIELLLSNGSPALSAGLIALAAASIFWLRNRLLARGNLRLVDLVLWAMVVLAPFSLLLDGAYFVVRLYELMALYMALNIIVNAYMWLKPGPLMFRWL
jgi:hypothetical protein